VIELPDGVSILSAVLRGGGSQLLSTPIAPADVPRRHRRRRPRPRARARRPGGAGLVGLDAIAAAVKWLDDSKQLIAMAMPQLSIDGHAPTQVQLLIDHADRTAEGLRPLLGNSRITIRTYRKLRWAGRTACCWTPPDRPHTNADDDASRIDRSGSRCSARGWADPPTERCIT
jgi:hypothetical protein